MRSKVPILSNEGDAMNMRVTIEKPSDAPKRGTRLLRKPIRSLSLTRLLRGGRLADAGRLPRYACFLLLGLMAVWAPITAYLAYAPPKYSSEFAFILPGAGASSSISVADIGQASSYANSAYSSSAISPTATYKRLLDSGRVLSSAARVAGETEETFGRPRIKLVDQTSLILVTMTGPDPEVSQRRARALLDTFLAELNGLRTDELDRRNVASRSAIDGYKTAVSEIRARITQLQQTAGLTSTKQFDAMVENMETLAARVSDVEAKYRLAAGVTYALQNSLQIDTRSAALALKLYSDHEYKTLVDMMSNVASDMSLARAEYGPRHPTRIAAETDYRGALGRVYSRATFLTGVEPDQLGREIDLSANGERAELLSGFVEKVSERDGLASEHESLSRELDSSRARILSLVDTAAELDDLNRDYQVAEAVFASALARSDTTKSDIYASYPLAQVLEPASLPVAPSSPNQILAIAAGGGATFCLLIALFFGWIRRSLIDRVLKTRAAD